MLLFSFNSNLNEVVPNYIEEPSFLDVKNLIRNNTYIDNYYPGAIVRDTRLSNADIIKTNKAILTKFLEIKRLEGRSKSTLYGYKLAIKYLIYDIIKPFNEMTTIDLRDYLLRYQELHTISNSALDDKRRIISTFFKFLEEEDIILKSPANKLHKIKFCNPVKKPFEEEDIALMRDVCPTIRELSLIDFLNSSGVRVSELCALNRNDINLIEKEGIVLGKGGKERIFYIDAQTKVHLTKYLVNRHDRNPALFVASHAPYHRITKSGVEYILKEIEKASGVTDIHPHRFRRTLATRLLNKGVPIEQVQRILGHSKIETTLIYAQVNQQEVKLNHRKYSS